MTLRIARETLTVENPTVTHGSEGQLTRGAPWSPPVTVRVNTYPLSATELELNPGLTNVVTRKVFVREEWPGHQYSKITYEGQAYEQVGPAVEYDTGVLTKHTQLIIRKVSNGL